MLYTGDKLSSPIFCCLSVCQASVSPDQISTFSNIYRHTSPLLTMYHLISSSTNLYWPSTSQYRHILTQYHQVPLIIHHLVRQSSVNWIISLFTTHLMSHAQYTWSSWNLLITLRVWSNYSIRTNFFAGFSFCSNPFVATYAHIVDVRTSSAGSFQWKGAREVLRNGSIS